MIIKELLKDVEIIEEKNTLEDLDIRGVEYDSRKVEPGFLFVAIEGLETDGHLYVDQAIKNGAVALMVTKDVDSDLPIYKTKNNRKSLAIVSNNWYGYPSRDLDLIGITASNGKTSTSMMVQAILEACGQKPGLIGTVKYKIGEREIASKLTTPESLELQGIFTAMLEEGIDTCIMEVSSIAQEMYRVYGTDFDVVAMNNITREHIDQHGTFEKYFEEKKKTITNAKEDAFVILNIEDQHAKSLISETKGRVITFSDKDEMADVYAKNIDLSSGNGKFDLVVSNNFQVRGGNAVPGRYPVNLRVAGYHSIVNALSAISISLSLGYPIEDIIKGLESYRGIERRFQVIYDDEFIIVDDHFANIGNINMSLQTLEKMDYNKAHIVYAIRGNRGVTVNGENADTIIKWKDRVPFENFIATMSRDTTEAHDYVHDDELEIFERKMKEAGIDYDLHENLVSAVGEALDRVEEGDLIFLAGCQGIDHGGKIILDLYKQRHPEKDDKELYAGLEGRIAGMDFDCGC